MGKHTDRYGRNQSDIGALLLGIDEANSDVTFEHNAASDEDASLPSRTAKGKGFAGKRQAREFNMDQQGDVLNVNRRSDAQVDVEKRLDPIKAASQLRQATLNWKIAHGIDPTKDVPPDVAAQIDAAYAAERGAKTSDANLRTRTNEANLPYLDRTAKAAAETAEGVASKAPIITQGNNLFNTRSRELVELPYEQTSEEPVYMDIGGKRVATGGTLKNSKRIGPSTLTLGSRDMIKQMINEETNAAPPETSSGVSMPSAPSDPYIGGKSPDDWLSMAGPAKAAAKAPSAPVAQAPSASLATNRPPGYENVDPAVMADMQSDDVPLIRWIKSMRPALKKTFPVSGF